MRETDLQRATPPVVQHPVALILSAACEVQEQTDSQRDRSQPRKKLKGQASETDRQLDVQTPSVDCTSNSVC